jgi:signal transduction histidine kinase
MSEGWPNPREEDLPDRRLGDRRKSHRRSADRALDQALCERIRKLESLLELGQLIGFDLQIDAIILQIAHKATEVMEADRCSIFLHDPKADELWSTVAMGLAGQVIRMPSSVGLAGHCFKTGKSLNLPDAYEDPRFNREVDARTGYRTRSVLCMPIHTRAGETLGVIQLLNKKEGVFTGDDETFLQTFGNHASVFIELAQLQRARIQALEQTQEELRRLNRAKDKALNHLAHEIKTPLAVIQGSLRLLKRRFQGGPAKGEWEGSFERLERHLGRLLEVQQQTDEILRSHEPRHDYSLHQELETLLEQLEEAAELPRELKVHCAALKAWMERHVPSGPAPLRTIPVFPLLQRAVGKVRRRASHRDLDIQIDGERDLFVRGDSEVLEEVIEGLLRNAVENTPDEGRIRLLLESTDERGLLKVRDFGIGITSENRKYIFDGLFPTQEIEQYTSGRPYDFNAGGKGLDLLRMKIQGQRLGFSLSVESRRCVHLPTDRYLCPGRISRCSPCTVQDDCFASGGSTFCVSLPMAKGG